MTTNDIYFFDTYALVEIIEGSENYRSYKEAELVITKLNLFELFYALLKRNDIQKAVFYLDQFNQFVVDFDENDIENAAKLKFSNKRLSMTDCIGYVVALKADIKVLTGNKEFEIMRNVEFVK